MASLSLAARNLPPARVYLVKEYEQAPVEIISQRVNVELRRLTRVDASEITRLYQQHGSQITDPRKRHLYMLSLVEAVINRRNGADAVNQVMPQTTKTEGYSAPPAHAPRPAPEVPTPQANAGQPFELQRPPPPRSPPKRIGHYVFKRTLGQGTFGKVKLAEHVQTKKQYAIKIIEKANVKTLKQRISVTREVRLMKLLKHPHIVDVVDVLDSRDFIMIVMEHASGGELFDYIVKHGCVKEQEARHFFRQIISAVDYCHQNSVIHRDLKPENLLLDDQHNMRLIDFGFGNTFHRERLLNTFCGSPFYAAPEMIRGIQYVGPEVDIWSMGVILFALLAGHLPFDGANLNDLYERIGSGIYHTPPEFSPEAAHLISRMLTIDPHRRATLHEIKNHVWTNTGYNSVPPNYLPRRPATVPEPHPVSLEELVSFGFKAEDARMQLQRNVGLHPMTCLYHLIDEARQRREAVNANVPMVDSYKPPETTLDQSIMNPSRKRSTQINQETPPTMDLVAVFENQQPLKTNVHSKRMALSTATPSSQTTQATIWPTLAGMISRDNKEQPEPMALDDVVIHSDSLQSKSSTSSLNRGRTMDTSSDYARRTRSSRRSQEQIDLIPGQENILSHSLSSVVSRVRGLFNLTSTLKCALPIVLQNLHRILLNNSEWQVSSQQTSAHSWTFQVTMDNTTSSSNGSPSRSGGHAIEIHVSGLSPDTTNENVSIQWRRLRGSVWSHKKICSRLISELDQFLTLQNHGAEQRIIVQDGNDYV